MVRKSLSYKYKTDAKLALICTVFSPIKLKLRVTQANHVVVENFQIKKFHGSFDAIAKQANLDPSWHLQKYQNCPLFSINSSDFWPNSDSNLSSILNAFMSFPNEKRRSKLAKAAALR